MLELMPNNSSVSQSSSIVMTNPCLTLLFVQTDRMRRRNASLRGGQHIPQVPYHHQVLLKDVEQRERDAHLHLSRGVHGGRDSPVELDVCHSDRNPVHGGSCSG